MFSVLPIEVQHYIVQKLDQPEDLAKVATLSKHFYNLSINSDTWQLLVQRKFNITDFYNVPKNVNWKLFYREKEAMSKPLSWNSISNESSTHPTPRHCHGAVAVGSKMLIFGGHQIEGTAFNRKDDMWYFDPATNEFQEIQPQGVRIPPISRHRLVVIENRVYSFGGILHNLQKLNSVFMFDPATLTWSELATKNTPPEPRCDPVVVAYKHQIIVFGGSIKDLAFPSDVHVFDTHTLTWSQPQISGDIPTPRIGCNGTVLRDTLFIYGGGDYNREEKKYNKLFDQIYTLDLISWTWKLLTVKGEVPKVSDYLNSFVVGNHIVIGGGWCTNPHAFDTLSRTWLQLPNSQSTTINNNDSSAVKIGNVVYYFGGYFQNYVHHLNALDIGHLNFLTENKVERPFEIKKIRDICLAN
jgi:hypothetical protein